MTASDPAAASSPCEMGSTHWARHSGDGSSGAK